VKESKTEIIVSETIHLSRQQARALDALIAKIQRENSFKPSRGLILRCLVDCLAILPLRTRGITSERSLRLALQQSLDSLKTGEIEAGGE
jgi:hypothetical protein